MKNKKLYDSSVYVTDKAIHTQKLIGSHAGKGTPYVLYISTFLTIIGWIVYLNWIFK